MDREEMAGDGRALVGEGDVPRVGVEGGVVRRGAAPSTAQAKVFSAARPL